MPVASEEIEKLDELAARMHLVMLLSGKGVMRFRHEAEPCWVWEGEDLGRARAWLDGYQAGWNKCFGEGVQYDRVAIERGRAYMELVTRVRREEQAAVVSDGQIVSPAE